MKKFHSEPLNNQAKNRTKMKIVYCFIVGQALCSPIFSWLQSANDSDTEMDAELDWLISYDSRGHGRRHEDANTRTKTRKKTRGHERCSDYSSPCHLLISQEYPKQRRNTIDQFEQRLKARFFKSVRNTKTNRQRFEDHFHKHRMNRFAH